MEDANLINKSKLRHSLPPWLYPKALRYGQGTSQNLFQLSMPHLAQGLTSKEVLPLLMITCWVRNLKPTFKSYPGTRHSDGGFLIGYEYNHLIGDLQILQLSNVFMSHGKG